MSLIKTYAVGCNGSEYRYRKGLPPSSSNTCKGKTQVPTDSAAEARRWAKVSGWKRHTEQFDIFSDLPSAGKTKITFDLCPVCAFALLPLDS